MKKYNFSINGKNIEVTVKSIANNIATVDLDGREVTVNINQISDVKNLQSSTRPVMTRPVIYSSAIPETAPEALQDIPGKLVPPEKINAGTLVNAPIPGMVTSIKVNVGDEVKVGQTILTMEAMKMENSIEASIAGRIQKVLVTKGDSVTLGQTLFIIE